MTGGGVEVVEAAAVSDVDSSVQVVSELSVVTPAALENVVSGAGEEVVGG
jgi:hypothetical protein